jgi:hypothetical protein
MSSDPVLIAYGVKKASGTKRNIWHRIGQAFPHDQGAGLTVVLDVLPLDGRVILLEPDAADDKRLNREAGRFRKHEVMIGSAHD